MKLNFIYLLSFLIVCSLTNCQSPYDDQSNNDNALFEKLNSSRTGIKFENKLHETDTANALFYEYYYNGSGVAIGDLNNDGRSDIFFGGNMEKSRLYLNNGDFNFKDITEQSGINTTGSWVTGICLVDINQDGWMDIYISVGGNIVDDYRNLLYINNGNRDHLTFSEKAYQVGLDDDGYSTQAAFFDYDRDGDLDMYLATSAMNVPNKNRVRMRKGDGSMVNTDRLYRNDGLDSISRLPIFHNVSNQAGITWDGFGLGIGISDINLDGWPDIYVANDYLSNDLLYINQGDGTFREMVKDYFKHISYSAMGVDIADFNNDGLVDVFAVDMLPNDHFRKRIMAGNTRAYERYKMEQEAGYSEQFIRNTLQLNNGKISGVYSFSEIGQLAGVFETDWSWTPLFADFDNDGYKDLFISNGIPHDVTNMDFSAFWAAKIKEEPNVDFNVLWKVLMKELNKKENVKKPNFIYRNNGNLVFDDKSRAWGIDQPSYSTSAAFSDLDNDGDLDLVVNNINAPAFVYKNNLINHQVPDSLVHYLQIKLSGSSPNLAGIGSKISIYYDNRLQFYEHFPVRGFQSMVDPKIHFGLKDVREIDSLHIWWPDGKEQYLYDIPADSLLILKYSEASLLNKTEPVEDSSPTLFTEVSDQLNINYHHQEREFVDYRIQPLVPHQYSKEGPGIAVGDINQDGLDDFFIGGSTSYSGAFFIQHRSGSFSSYPLPGNKNFEDMGALFFDADSDGDEDLYVVSGGTGLPPGNPFYNDRLYLNDGKGEFVKAENALPEIRVCGSQVTAADFDKDGDLDLFVCTRVDLENYPIPASSYLLRNDSNGGEVRFTDITDTVSPELGSAGLISAALWTDFDGDGWVDLILAGEWMPLTFFKNQQGRLVNITSQTGLEQYTGWWNSLTAADFDKDGDIDYVAGNLGLNTRFKVSQDQPMRIVAKDFDRDGLLDPVCSYYVQGKSYPIHHRDQMLQQMPYLQEKFTTYEDFAKAGMSDIFSEQELDGAYTADSRYFESAYIENMGDGLFEIHPLPFEAQFGPVFGILTNDYNGDGHADLLLTGNSYSSNVETGRYDAFIGLFLEGDGKGKFSAVLGRESKFFVDGDAKGMAELTTADGRSLILAAQNSGDLKIFKTRKSEEEIIRLKKDDVFAEIKYKSGKTERREFYYGSGYLSHSSRVCRVPGDAVSVIIITYTGETRDIIFNQ